MKMKNVVAMFATLAGLVVAPVGHAVVIDAGWDLLQTTTAYFNYQGSLIPFEGSPLGSFNFGGNIGPQNTGLADTIVYRDTSGTLISNGDSFTTGIQIQGLSLKSKVQFSGNYLYATLDTSKVSGGSMKISYDGSSGGTFISSFDLYGQIHVGSPTGNVLTDFTKHFTTTNASWVQNPPLGVTPIPGVNDNNFFVKNALHDAGDGSVHGVTAAVPEPEEWAMMLVGAAMVSYQVKRKAAKQLKTNVA